MKLNKQIIPGKYLYFYSDDMFVKGFYISGLEVAYCIDRAVRQIGYATWLGGIRFNIR